MGEGANEMRDALQGDGLMNQALVLVGGVAAEAEPLASLGAQLDVTYRTLAEFVRDPSGVEPRCLVLDWRDEKMRSMLREARQGARFPVVPIVAILERPWAAEVGQAFTDGIDDYVIRGAVDDLRHKLVALLKDGYLPANMTAGQVVLAAADREQRILLASTLRRMGFDVRFAVGVEDVPTDAAVKLVVASAGLDGLSEALVARTESSPPWLIAGNKHELAALDLGETKGIKTHDTAGEPSQVVFAANQLLTQDFQQLRRSRRLPYGTPASFCAGSAGLTHGFTYNVSLGGLFVRTMTPPGLGSEVELEFSPPHGRGRVLVVGRVAWREARPINPSGIPCGFGVQYDELPVADGAALEAGYAALLAEAED